MCPLLYGVKMKLVWFLVLIAGCESHLKITVRVEKPGSLCQGVILTINTIQTLCSCVSEQDQGIIVAASLKSVRVAKKRVSSIELHPLCKSYESFYIYDSALVAVSQNLDVFGDQIPAREPAMSLSKFDSDLSSSIGCGFAAHNFVPCERAGSKQCVDTDKVCKSEECTHYFTHYTFCVAPIDNTTILKGTPFVCDSGLTWGVFSAQQGSYVSVLKVMLFDQIRKSASIKNLPSIFLITFLTNIANFQGTR